MPDWALHAGEAIPQNPPLWLQREDIWAASWASMPKFKRAEWLEGVNPHSGRAGLPFVSRCKVTPVRWALLGSCFSTKVANAASPRGAAFLTHRWVFTLGSPFFARAALLVSWGMKGDAALWKAWQWLASRRRLNLLRCKLNLLCVELDFCACGF